MAGCNDTKDLVSALVRSRAAVAERARVKAHLRAVATLSRIRVRSNRQGSDPPAET